MFFCNYTSNRKYDVLRHHNAKHNNINIEMRNNQKDNKNEKNVNQNNENVNQNNENVNQNEKNVNQNEKNVNQNEKNVNQSKNNDIYTCIKCNKNYKIFKTYEQHQQKCNGINSLTCPKCMKLFKSRHAKSAHIKKNKCKPKSIIYLDNEYIKQGININGNNNNIITNNNIIIYNYGNERTDYITLDDYVKILKSGNNMIPNYIEFKYFNKDFPENNNIKYKQNIGCIIKKNDKWSIINIDYLTDNLFKSNLFELHKYYYKQKKEIDEKIKDIEVIEFITSRLNYLDLSVNKNILYVIKNEIKNRIRLLAIYT